MQTAETILWVIRERGRRKLPLERVYRLLFNRELYLLAYSRIHRNAGAMTPGATMETVDGMSPAKIDRIIEAVRHERYRWTPVRRVYIPKKRGSTRLRPLGLPPWSDKLLQEVIRLILEAYYEPQFSPSSHGFRPGRGCHTALTQIYGNWTGTTWFIEGDISQCFLSLNHSVLLSILAERVHDNRLLRLIETLLKAGYLEDWKFNRTLSGAPQGSGLSPILSNLYLDRLDKFVEQVLLPEYNRGTRRKFNPVYNKLSKRADYLRKKGAKEEAAALRKQCRAMPAIDTQDPDYRRLRYLRYADDILLGFCGPRSEAEAIKRRLGEFLRDQLKLELSEKKSLITHARTGAARFLGYEIHVIHNDQLLDQKRRRSTNGTIGLKVPADVAREKCRRYMRGGKAIHRMECTNDTVFSIVAYYQQEFRGVVEYYRLAYNLSAQLRRLKWMMEQSLTKTIARKLHCTVVEVYHRYQTIIPTPQGPFKGLMVKIERKGRPPLEAYWGGISLARRMKAVLNDSPKPVWNYRHTELVQRLLAEECELCGSQSNVQVHHVRALKALRRKGYAERAAWEQTMISRRRKTLIVCESCHAEIHAGRADGRERHEAKRLESRMPVNGHVRFGGGPGEKGRYAAPRLRPTQQKSARSGRARCSGIPSPVA